MVIQLYRSHAQQTPCGYNITAQQKKGKGGGEKATLRKSYNNKPDYSATKRGEEGLTGSLYPVS